MTTRVIHAKNAHQFEPDEFVWITRDTKWGNPYIVGTDGTREEVIAKYDRWLDRQLHLLAALEELRDKVLVCYCKPKACHGDVLKRRLEQSHGQAQG